MSALVWVRPRKARNPLAIFVIGRDSPRPRAGNEGSSSWHSLISTAKLLERCLGRKPRAWEDFVDRYMGLVMHVINHSAQARSIRLSNEDREDLCAEVCMALVRKDFAVLRRFRGQSSLATYLTVVARRIVVKHLLASKSAARLAPVPAHPNGFPAMAKTATPRIASSTATKWNGCSRISNSRSPRRAAVSHRRQELPRDQHGYRHAGKQRRADAQPRPRKNAP